MNGLSLMLAIPAALLAVVLVLLGSWSYYRGAVRAPTAALASLGGGAVAALGWPLAGPLYLGVVPAVPVAVVAAVAGAATWLGLGLGRDDPT